MAQLHARKKFQGSDLQLQSKILVLLIPLIVLPILVLGWMAYSLLMDDARNRTQNHMKTQLEQIESQTVSQLRTARANASLFANTALIKQYVEEQKYFEDKSDLEKQVLDLLYNYQLAYPEYYEMRIISRDGKEQIRSVLGNVANQTTNESLSSYFLEVVDNPGVTYTTFFRNPDNNQPALLTSKPLYLSGKSGLDKRKNIYGYLMLTIDLNFLKKRAIKKNAGEGGDVFFTDNSGTILFHSVAESIGEKLPGELFSQSKQHADGSTQIDWRYLDKDAHFQAIKLHDWLYAFVVSQEEALLAKSAGLGWTVTLVTSFAMLLATALLFGVLKKLLIKPIQTLSHAVSEMGHGKLLIPIEIDSDDEIGELAARFREMGKNLHNSHEQVSYVAYHDSLTGLPNRLMFKDYLNRATAAADVTWRAWPSCFWILITSSVSMTPSAIRQVTGCSRPLPTDLQAICVKQML